MYATSPSTLSNMSNSAGDDETKSVYQRFKDNFRSSHVKRHLADSTSANNVETTTTSPRNRKSSRTQHVNTTNYTREPVKVQAVSDVDKEVV